MSEIECKRCGAMVPVKEYRDAHVKPSAWCVARKGFRLLDHLTSTIAIEGNVYVGDRTPTHTRPGAHWNVLDKAGLVRWCPVRTPVILSLLPRGGDPDEPFAVEEPCWRAEDCVSFSPLAPIWACDLLDALSSTSRRGYQRRGVEPVATPLSEKYGDTKVKTTTKVWQAPAYTTGRGAMVSTPGFRRAFSIKFRIELLTMCIESPMYREFAADDLEALLKLTGMIGEPRS